jgi:hypothetical protein
LLTTPNPSEDDDRALFERVGVRLRDDAATPEAATRDA